jgi:hypothetical protein
MSTTTEVPIAHPVAAFAGQCAAVLAIWTALAAFITVVWEPAGEAIVFGTPERTLSFLAGSDTRIVELTSTYLIVHGNEPGFVRRLYAHGAWIVLPARAGGCLSLSVPRS